jgi:anti-anti-sigma factor
MRARLVLVDFEMRTAALAVEPASTPMRTECVRDTVALLAAWGFGGIDVWLDPRVPTALLREVRDTLSGGPAQVYEASHNTWIEARGSRIYQRAGQVGSAGTAIGPIFEACLECLPDLIPRCTRFVALVQSISNMDAKTAGRLRFVATELCTNAVDHAVFGPRMRIELAAVVSASHTLFVYRDNAQPFVTTSRPDIDIESKIARGDRRGFGLFMLDRMAQMRHRRHGDWNETTVLLTADGTSPESRSSVMEEFKLEQVPSPLPDTIVLKPAGSVDSTSVHMLDAKLVTLSSQPRLRLVIDLSSVTFLSSAGVGALLGTAAQLRAHGGDLIFLNPAMAVTDVFEIINLSAYFRTIHALDELEPVAQR